MKKIALAGLVALSLIALGQQQASAWVNSKFSIGLNWQMQSGNNNFFWGLYHNGQVPGPEAFGASPGYGAPFAGPLQHGYAAMPQSYDAPAQPYAGQYAAPAQPYASPYQFANYPRQVYYYYPPPSYYYGR